MKNCKEISELVSRSLDESLPVWKQMQIKMHLAMCRGCRRFSQQLKFLHQAVQNMSKSDACVERRQKLSQAGRERIRKIMDEHAREK